MNPNSTLTKTWKEQIRQVAARNPRLAQELWQNRPVYFERYAYFYRQLAALPRKFRRKFLKRLAMTLAGAALLLALGQALPARAATITVDGVVCTLAEAITSANNDDAAGNGCVDGNGADVIDLQTDVLLSAVLPSIASEITLEGNGHTLDGNDGFQVLNVQSSGDLTLNDTIILDGYATNGAGIHNLGTLTVNNSTLSGNFAGGSGSCCYRGGGIFNAGTLAVNDSTFTNNQAGLFLFFTGFGGGIWNSGTLTVNNSTFTGNLAGDYGGAGGGMGNSGTLTVNNSTLSGNTSDDAGGAIWNSGMLSVNDSTLSGNEGHFQGGGIENSGTLIVNNSTLSDNLASYGGGINNLSEATALVTGSTLSGNMAGGGIENFGILTLNSSILIGNDINGIHNESTGALEVNDSTLSGNEGSGLYNDGGAATVNNSTLSGNSGAFGGGGIYNRGGTVTLNNSTVSENSTSSFAGGIESSFEGMVEVNNSTLSGNSAGSYGGGIEVFMGGVVIVNNSTISGNSAPDFGGGIRNTSGTLILNNSTLTGNTTDGEGGGIHNLAPSIAKNSTRGDGVANNLINNVVYLNRSLLSGNQASSGAEMYNLGTVTADNFNVVGYGGDARSFGFTPGVLDIIPPGPLTTVLNTLLADNGGPTFTHALVSASVAIDAAPNAACLAPPINGVDQRGFPRNVDGDGSPSSDECDAGAFEFAPRVRPTKTPTPTGMPQSTRTPTPRPTRTPTPLTVQESALLPLGQEEGVNPFILPAGVSILAIGGLIWFRRGRV